MKCVLDGWDIKLTAECQSDCVDLGRMRMVGSGLGVTTRCNADGTTTTDMFPTLTIPLQRLEELAAFSYVARAMFPGRFI